MSLYQAIADGLGEIRREAEALMTDTFTVYKPGDPSDPVLDENGYEVPGDQPAGTVKGQLVGPRTGNATQARTVRIGDTERRVVEGGLRIPIDAPVPAMGEYGHGWEYVLTDLGPLTDPALLDSRWLVVDAKVGTLKSRRLDVVRID